MKGLALFIGSQYVCAQQTLMGQLTIRRAKQFRFALLGGSRDGVGRAMIQGRCCRENSVQACATTDSLDRRARVACLGASCTARPLSRVWCVTGERHQGRYTVLVDDKQKSPEVYTHSPDP